VPPYGAAEFVALKQQYDKHSCKRIATGRDKCQQLALPNRRGRTQDGMRRTGPKALLPPRALAYGVLPQDMTQPHGVNR